MTPPLRCLRCRTAQAHDRRVFDSAPAAGGPVTAPWGRHHGTGGAG